MTRGAYRRRPAIEPTGTLPAGEYYIGDPCYVLGYNDTRWNEFLRLLELAEGADQGKRAVVFELEGRQVFVSSTNTGDGCYKDNRGILFPVDAGMLAAIPVDLARPPRVGIVDRVQFAQPFVVGADVGRWLDRGKRIKFGHIIVKT